MLTTPSSAFKMIKNGQACTGSGQDVIL